MTRSLSCAVRGRFAESWYYHPMGWLVLGLFVVIAVQSVLPPHRRGTMMRFVEARALWFNSSYLIFVSAFVVFGLIRALMHLGAVLM